VRRPFLPWKLRPPESRPSESRSSRLRPSKLLPRILRSSGLVVAIALPVWISSCSRTGADVERASSDRASVVAAHPFLEAIQDATSKVAYSGTRHVSISYVVAGAPKVL